MTTHYIPGESGWASQAALWGSSFAGSARLRLECRRSYDPAANASTLTFTVWAHSESYYNSSFKALHNSGISVAGSPLVTFRDGGSAGTHAVLMYHDATWRQLKSVNGPNAWSVTLSHNADGSLSVPIQMNLTLYCTLGEVTYACKWSDSFTLTVTEPRGSAIAGLPAAVSTGESLSFSVERASTDYRHRAQIRCGQTLLYSSDLFGASLSLPVERSWFSNFPALESLGCTLAVQTYTDPSGQTALGDPRTASFTVNADALMRPAPLSGWASAAADNSGTAAEGISGFVSGMSRALVSLDGSKLDMSAAVGASVASVSVTGGGETATAAPYRTGVLTGTAAVTVTVTDSRGRSATQTLTVETMPYAPPVLRQVRVFRCDGQGNADEGGSYVSVTAVGSASSLEGQNSAELWAELAQGAGSYGAEIYLHSGAASVLGGTLDPDQRLRVRVTVNDDLGIETRTEILLPPQAWAMKFRPNGQGVGFGMAPTEDRVLQLPSGWKIKIGSTVVAQE